MAKAPAAQKQHFSILQWLTEEGIVSEKGEPFDWHNRPFLLDILTDFHPRQAVMACAQVGKSVTFSLKTLFAVKHLRFNVIYTMPTDSDVNEFVASKFNKIVQANLQEFRGMEADNIDRKELNGRFVFFKGTVSKTAAISTSADVLVHDEVSRSDQGAIETYKSRTKASPYKGRWLFSNPGPERDELDLAWQQSDQRLWTITCGACKQDQDLVWPDSVNMEGGYYQCRSCRARITDDMRRKGRYVPQNPGSDIHGYRISHLMCPDITVKEIIDDSKGDPGYFANFVLGLPYTPGDLQVSKSTILDIWTPRFAEVDTGPRFLGVDVGNMKHYVVRTHAGIVKIGRFTKWEDLDSIIATWKPQAGVIDAMPDNTAAKHYVDTYPFMEMSFFQENANNPQTVVWRGEGERTGIVYSHRDRVIDLMLTEMIEAKWLIAAPADRDFGDFIRHFETLRREKVTNNKGIERYIWASTTGVDHYVFASLYAWLATTGGGDGAFFGTLGAGEPAHAIGADNTYDPSELFREANRGGTAESDARYG